MAKAPIKSEARAIKKIMNDYGGDATRIKDLARNTIIVSQEKIGSVAAELASRGANIKVINGSVDPLGYSGVNSNPRTQAGIFGEIQANSPEMLYAKEPESLARALLGDKIYDSVAARTNVPGGLGHVYYEQWRVLDANSSLANSIAEQSRPTITLCEELMVINNGPIFSEGDVFIDYPFEEVLFRWDHVARKVYRRFYGGGESPDPVPQDNRLFNDAILFGNKITREQYHGEGNVNDQY